tara:strand:+ start:62 stop:238 length:177 start_codon:yes stop_codon:yes gene_type:complete
MTKLPKLQGLLDTLIDPNLRRKVKNSRLPNTRKTKVEKRLKQLQAKFRQCDWQYKNIN